MGRRSSRSRSKTRSRSTKSRSKSKTRSKSKSRSKSRNSIRHRRSKKTSTKKSTSEIGRGKDGVILKNIKCGKYTFKNGYVAKRFYTENNVNAIMNVNIQSKLKEIDEDELRFNRYHLPDSECQLGNNIVFQRYLKEVDIQKLSRKQYRFLRDSIKILHDNNISHGDLPNNVMIDKKDDMPRIIDWDNAKNEIDDLDKQIDNTAFLTHFKVLKK